MDPVSRFNPVFVPESDAAAPQVSPAVKAPAGSKSDGSASFVSAFGDLPGAARASIPGIDPRLHALLSDAMRQGDGHGVVPPAPRPVPNLCADNQFGMELSENLPQAAGGILEQSKQAGLSGAFSLYAVDRLTTGGMVFDDEAAAAVLPLLDRSAPLRNEPIATATYSSVVANSSPREVYERFVNNPDELFKAAAIELVPPTTELKDGARVFLLDQNPLPVLAPVEVRLNPQTLTVELNTLDGHPLRGTNRFQFRAEGEGTRIHQASEFQGSTPLTAPVIEYGGALERQHDIWRNSHAYLAGAQK